MWDLHLALSEPGREVPHALRVSDVCREFGCLPQAASAALLDDPEGLVDDVLLVRRYAAAKQALDAAMAGGPAVRDSALMGLVKRNTERRMLAKGGGTDG